MICINMAEELSLYDLEGKWNDFVGVQKEVLQVLHKKGFFKDGEVVNKQTGIHIRINAKGIKETIGSGKRFQKLPRKLKQYKIATLYHLKSIIENAELLADNVQNIHEENSYMFVYFGSEVLIDGERVGVRISVKKKITSNWFWMHNIDEYKKVLNYSTHR